MGTFEKGILGGFSGKVGSVVGSKWNGIDVMRSHPGKRGKNSGSKKQLEQQARFKLMSDFLHPIQDLLNETFGLRAKGMTGINKALSFNVVQAIMGASPNFAIDYSKVQVSRGSLPLVGSASCTSPAAGKLTFTWVDVDVEEGDLVFVVAYSPDRNRWIYLFDAAPRTAKTCTLDVTGLSGSPMQTWLGIFSADGRKVSNSLYTGVVTVL